MYDIQVNQPCLHVFTPALIDTEGECVLMDTVFITSRQTLNILVVFCAMFVWLSWSCVGNMLISMVEWITSLLDFN